MSCHTVVAKLDKEWLELIMEAKSLGLEIDNLRDFFNSKEITNDSKKYNSAVS